MDIERLKRMALAAWADWNCEADNTTESAAKFLDALKFKFDDLSEGGITHEVLNPYDDCYHFKLNKPSDKRKSITIKVVSDGGEPCTIVADKDGVRELIANSASS